MPEERLDGDKFTAAFDKWSKLQGAGAGAGANELLDAYSRWFSDALAKELFAEAQSKGMESLPYGLREQYESSGPSAHSTSKMIARDKVARVLSAKSTDQYYVLAHAVDEDYPADSKEILPCLIVKHSQLGSSVMLTDGTYSGTVFIVPTNAVSCVSEAEMRNISGNMF